MSKSKQHSWMTIAMIALACTSAWLSLAHAEEEEDSSMSLSEVVDLIDPFGQGCDPKPERSQVEEMVLNKENASHESKCFRRCMLQQFELMPEGQMEFNEEKTGDMMNMMFPENEATTKTIVAKCNKVMAGVTDECEIAHGISMCMLREMRTANYKIPDIKE